MDKKTINLCPEHYGPETDFYWTQDRFYTEMFKFPHGFVKFVKWICQSYCMYFLPIAQQNQAEVWPSYALSISGPLAIFFTFLSFLSESS